MRGNTNQGIFRVCREEERGSHILQYEGTRNWRGRYLEINSTIIQSDTGIRGLFSNKIKDIWPKIDQ
jgi:hypothetical protein